jgi:serine phosphatase RsbU (regulator of sigma subunit)
MTDTPGHGSLNLPFRTKLLLSMCGLVLLTGAVILYVADRSSRAGTQLLVHSLFREVSSHAASQTKDFLRSAAPVAQSLEQLSDQGLALDDMNKLAPQLLAFLKGNPGMTRVLYGDERGDHVAASRQHDGQLHIELTRMSDAGTHLAEYIVKPDGSWDVVKMDDTSGYDPRKRPFYILAKDKGRLAWTPPYMFFTDGVPGISCVIPAKDSAGHIRGVFDVEFALNALSDFVSRLAVSDHSRVFLFTTDQTLLAHPNLRDLVGTGVRGKGAMLTLADTGDPLVDAFRQHLRPEYLIRSDAETFHFFDFNHDNADYLASTTVFPVGDGQSWAVGAIAPRSDFLAGVWRTRLLSLAAALAALALAALLAAAMARRISKPVQSLIGVVKRVGAGDLDAKASIEGGGEFQALSQALNRMIVDLRERLHLRHSLHVAMEVQKTLLPASDPLSPKLDVAGRSKYCDETGGDYYDFIDVAPISKSSLLIAVGDVMGHGIPAALVMATVRAALRTSALSDRRLADLMTRTNQVLAADNRLNRFVTLSLLLIDADARTVRWASAGHDPAVVYDPRSGQTRKLEGGDVPLGVMPDTHYEEFATQPLPRDSVIIIGTDGVWEMANEQGQQYGKERMERLVREHHDMPAAQIAAALEDDLAAFRGSQSPSDDVTFVIVKFHDHSRIEGDASMNGDQRTRIGVTPATA